jgi:hypothetical protein
MVEATLQEVSQYITLAGVLGGFAFAAMIELLLSEKKGTLVTIVIAMFATAALMFLYSLIVNVLLYSALLTVTEITTTLNKTGANLLWVIFGAIFLLLASIGLAGWLHSKATGIATSMAALIFACLMLVSMVSVVMALPPPQ